jgi:hypothetical protein
LATTTPVDLRAGRQIDKTLGQARLRQALPQDRGPALVDLDRVVADRRRQRSQHRNG